MLFTFLSSTYLVELYCSLYYWLPHQLRHIVFHTPFAGISNSVDFRLSLLCGEPIPFTTPVVEETDVLYESMYHTF